MVRRQGTQDKQEETPMAIAGTFHVARGLGWAAAAVAWLCVFAAAARADGRFGLVAGGGTGGAGGPATAAKLGQVFGVDADAAGNLFVVEYTNRLWRIDPAGVIHAVAGDGQKGDRGDGGPAADARLNVPHAVAVHRPTGDVYVADTGNFRVRRIDAKTGVISTFAGTGTKGAAGDGGPAKDATFGGLYCLAFDPGFTKLVVTDLDHKQVRSIDLASGVVTRVAGNGQSGVPADGADAESSPLVDPRAACPDAAGNVYVLERGGHALRVVDASGKIRTVVGTGKKGAGGDGGPALAAQLNGPKHLCVDRAGYVLIADTENHVVRRYDVKTGTIARVAGTGQRGAGAPGGEPVQTPLSQPHGVYVATDGTVYVCDSMNGRVLKIVE
jgi:sugar lactone lactonase YvrE